MRRPRGVRPGTSDPCDPVSKSDTTIILPAPGPSRVDYQIRGGGCLWPRRLSKKLICQVYLPLVGSRRRRTKQPLRMEDKADKGERSLWKMKQGFSFRRGDALYQAKESVRTRSISAPSFDSLVPLCVTELPFSL